MAYTPMFEKLINTKPERERCLEFLKFLEDKGIVKENIDTEKTVSEFFGIDLRQTEDERKMLIKEFHETAVESAQTASDATVRTESKIRKELGKEKEKKFEVERPIGQETAGKPETNAEALAEKVQLNSHGVNAKIKANILPERRMRGIGFTDYVEAQWHFCRGIDIKESKDKKSRKKNENINDVGISFSVTIPKNGSDIRIDVLDQWSCQPYDYQYILEKDPEHKIANIVKEQVEYWMEKLQEEGVLKGHVRGEYI